MKNNHQRVSEKDAHIILEKLIKDFNTPLQCATSYDEDPYGGSQRHINESIIDDLIKKITRPCKS